MTDPHAPAERPFDHSGYTAFLSDHQLMASRCTNCGRLYLPPRSLCPACYHAAMEWAALSGEGELTGFTTISVGLPAMIAEGYNRHSPYCTGVVRLKEGPSISGQLINVDCANPQTLQVGMPVRAAFIERGEGQNRRVHLVFEKK